MNMDEFKILAIVFAISYSVASAFAILASTDKKIIILFGVLDAIGVLLYYITYIPLQISAVYFSIYTCSLILSTIRTSKPLSISGLIIEMKSSGIPQNEIAKRLNISESKVSRILNKNSKKPK
jgi:hypothetical protein